MTEYESEARDVISKDELVGILPDAFGFNETLNVLKIWGFMGACALKKHLDKGKLGFPHLGIFGGSGSGKTGTIKTVIGGVFPFERIMTAGSTTRFSLANRADSYAPLVIDECNFASRNPFDLIGELIVSSYTSEATAIRLNGQEVIEFVYRAPVILAGEQNSAEPLILDRQVTVTMNEGYITPERIKCFNRLKEKREVMRKIGRLLTLTAQNGEFHAVDTTDTDIGIPHQMHNIAIILKGLDFVNFAVSNVVGEADVLWKTAGIEKDYAIKLFCSETGD